MGIVTEADVLILGSGCAGLFIADALVRAGYTVAVADRQPFGGFASTRNYGWLHSGLFELVWGNEKLAQHCFSGSQSIRQRFPAAISSKRGVFLLSSDEQQFKTLYKCKNLLPELRERIQSVSARKAIPEPLQKRRRDLLRLGLSVPDVAFDPAYVLRTLYDQLKTKIHPIEVASCDRIVRRRDTDNWFISRDLDSNTEIRSRIVIEALGAAGTNSRIPRLSLLKLTACIVKGSRMANGPVIATLDPTSRIQAPMVIPHRECDKTVVAFTFFQEKANGKLDIIPSSSRERELQALCKIWLGPMEIEQTYACQRLMVKDLVLEEVEGALIAYPHYFSMAPVLAERCLSEVTSRLGAPWEGGASKQGLDEPRRLSLD